MDLYRYFHPHHNPTLRATALRLQEIAELNQAAVELRKALRRAQIRTANSPIGEIKEEHFQDMLTAIDYIVEALSTLSEAHPGDDLGTMKHLLKERSDAPGWENWARLLQQRLRVVENSPMGEGS